MDDVFLKVPDLGSYSRSLSTEGVTKVCQGKEVL